MTRRLRTALPLAVVGAGLTLVGSAAGGIASLDSPLATAAAVQQEERFKEHHLLEVGYRGCEDGDKPAPAHRETEGPEL